MPVPASPGHGSMPRADTAIAWMADLITRLTRTPMRRRVTPLIRTTLNELGMLPEKAPPIFRPLMAKTVPPTILRRGYTPPAIPAQPTPLPHSHLLPPPTVI